MVYWWMWCSKHIEIAQLVSENQTCLAGKSISCRWDLWLKPPYFSEGISNGQGFGRIGWSRKKIREEKQSEESRWYNIIYIHIYIYYILYIYIQLSVLYIPIIYVYVHFHSMPTDWMKKWQIWNQKFSSVVCLFMMHMLFDVLTRRDDCMKWLGQFCQILWYYLILLLSMVKLAITFIN